MATDNSPPRLKLIVTIGVITVVTLVGLRFVMDSYFSFMSDVAHREKIAPTTELENHHKEEQAALAAAKVPVGEAMSQLAKGNRGGLIAPQQSDDLGPMTGWSKLPKAAPEAHAGQGGEPAAADAGAEATDGGAAATGDAGAEPNAAADAGAEPNAAADAGATGRVVPVGAHDGGVNDAGQPVPAPTPHRPPTPHP